jgi:hypothetical protein
LRVTDFAPESEIEPSRTKMSAPRTGLIIPVFDRAVDRSSSLLGPVSVGTSDHDRYAASCLP